MYLHMHYTDHVYYYYINYAPNSPYNSIHQLVNATYNALDSAYMLVCMSVSADYVYQLESVRVTPTAGPMEDL